MDDEYTTLVVTDKPVDQASFPKPQGKLHWVRGDASEMDWFDDQSDDYLEGADHASSWETEGPEVVKIFVDAFVELIIDFGAPVQVVESFRGNTTEFLTCPDEMTYWGRAKNLSCFFKAKFLRCLPPDVDGYKYCGHWKRWSQSRMHFTRRNVSLWSSTFKLKNAAARLTERAAVVTMHKHRSTVGKEMETDAPVVEKVVRSIMPLLEKAGKYIADRFYAGDWEIPHAASNSACYEDSRRDFGQIGHFMERVFGSGTVVVPGIGFCGFGPQQRAVGTRLDAVMNPGYDYESYEARLSHVEREELPTVKEVHFYEDYVLNGVNYQNSWFETYYFPAAEKVWLNEIFIDALISCDRELALAKVACVLEPFKVRIITKGEAALQYVSGFFQKSVFAFNQTVPAFGLVGRKPSTFDLIDIRDNCGRGDPDSAFGEHSEYVWASSDFSGASDGTNGHYRDCIMDVLICGLPLDIQSIIRACNGSHWVTYPGPLLYPSMEELGPVEGVQQWLGTLMGERTSFPILCYEVLGAHVSNLRRCGDLRPLDAILEGVRINGDDRLALSTRALESEFWEFSEKYLGFKESIGKSYTHTRYANINSQSYICDVMGGTPWKVPVRASGLEHGQKKLDEPFDPTSVLNQILDGCIDTTMEWTVLQRYLVRFADSINSIAAGRNLFAHPSLGGLGNRLPETHGKKRCRRANGELCGHLPGTHWKVSVTLEQQFVASAILRDPGAFLAPVGPTLVQQNPLPQLFETPWDVYGKPSYWDDTAYIWEMDDRYRKELL